jgi:membrane protein required for colicin V production
MNYIDIIIIIMMVVSAISGAVKGLIYEVTSLVALFAGIWGAIEFSGATESFMNNKLNSNNGFMHIIAFVITFVLIIVLVHFVGKAVESAAKTIKLSVINRIMGLFFAIVKSAFILGIIVLVIESVDDNLRFVPKKDVQESSLSKPLKGLAINTLPFVNHFFEGVKEQKKYFDGDEEYIEKRKNKKERKKNIQI